ncbi:MULTISPECIES: MAPEG family protein [unclassified Ruegeria]|uniref:MAPEG family protein n=1 Tax=unclassified Ruegeria TaxID=2625375 RepID=UPI001ADB2369|nr:MULTISPECIES: MAPEG family protein [unclassified Ruegeria]MBO9411557.1 MAPEG family protein [Ruegeria sp. R8_1]MBO9415881.1 MAPEG family protein [Ruegeria sp. R8_2]
MSSELSILALYGLVVIVVVLLNVLTAMSQVGLMTLGGARDDMPPLTGVAGRVERALANSVVAMALFAPAVLILSAKDAFTGGTLFAAQIFLLARIAFVPIYAFAIPVPFLRTTVWLAGFLATAYLYLQAL